MANAGSKSGYHNQTSKPTSSKHSHLKMSPQLRNLALKLHILKPPQSTSHSYAPSPALHPTMLHFLKDLPREIRDQIYIYCLTTPHSCVTYRASLHNTFHILSYDPQN